MDLKRMFTILPRSLKMGLLVLAVLVMYAYGFQVTKVNLTEIRSLQRQESLARVLRALARPDIFAFEETEISVEHPFFVPCPAGGAPQATPPEQAGPHLVVNAPCAEPRSQIQVEGVGFAPNTSGELYFVPPSEVTLRLANIKTDGQGHFSVRVTVPPRPEEQVQHLLVITAQRVGGPHLSKNALETWDKIVETVFLALLATTFGIILAIPVSFLAARNLMKDVTSTLRGLALSILAWPAGIWLGMVVSGWIGAVSPALSSNPPLALVCVVISLAFIVWALRWALPQEELTPPAAGIRLARYLVLLLAGLVSILSLFLLSSLAISLGKGLVPWLGGLAFLAKFISSLGEILEVLITTLAALAGGYVLSSLAGRLLKRFSGHLSGSARLSLNLVLGALAGAVLALLLGATIHWFYQVNDPARMLTIFAITGGVLGLITAIVTRKADVLPTGLVIYTLTRTILNALRAIEALIMAIVFVVWVGIGPFAGVLALSLHTVAALAKLYSEQVESISSGPLEAVKATGATRLQTIVYAVIPQIIPPYISFTMYRWDINVRMSTIIGFAGGGGIGFLLIQNINLLNYRAASTQMLAIAIVVALMDFLSSYMRERVI
jgi:phosphonate ABC transporter permease subunit PhnE